MGNMPERIVICGPLLGDARCRIGDHYEVIYSDDQVLSQARFDDLLGNSRCAILQSPLTMDRTRLNAASKLTLLSNIGVGCDNIDCDYARTRGVLVTNTPVLAESMGDLVFALILSTARHIPEADRMMREHRFRGWQMDLLLGHDVHGKTLGIFGCGRIGQAVARRARGFDMRVLYHNRHPLDESVETEQGLTFATFDELIDQSDFLVITSPLNEQCRHRFTLDEFKKMKRSAVLINAGRGPVVKEDDLVVALRERLIWGAGLDVYEFEPKMADELEKCPNTTLLPHLGSASHTTRVAVCDAAVQAVLDHLEGRRPRYVVND